jgi:trigger factor
VEKIYGKGMLYEEAVNALYPQALDAAIVESGYEYVEDKNAYVMTREDQNGNLVHTVLTMTISTKHPSDLAERKPKAKKPSENQEVEVE